MTTPFSLVARKAVLPADAGVFRCRAAVNDLDTVQIRAADHYVYMHPRSTRLETFARDTARQWRTDHANR